MTPSWRRDEFEITTDPARVDLDVVHEFLASSYWARGIPREVVERSIRHSLPFSVWTPQRQVAFARVISDRATFAYLGDVFVLPEYRGRGLSNWLMQVIVEHPDLQGLRRWSLLTRDAHGLYEKVGFRPLEDATRWMERHDPDVYSRPR
jgi:GNAT superfamily N-acetyltransferase